MKKIVLINSFLTAANIGIKFLLNIYLAQEFPESQLVEYFVFVDIITWVAMMISGLKDVLVRATAKHKWKSFRHFVNIAGILFLLIFLFILPTLCFANQRFLFLPAQYPLWALELAAFLLLTNTILGQLLLANRIYSIVSYIDVMRGVLFVLVLFFVYTLFDLSTAYHYLLTAFIAANLSLLFWLLFNIKRYVFPDAQVLKESLRTNFLTSREKRNINYSVVYASLEYFTASASLYLSSLIMLNVYGSENVGDFQIVARPVYLALISVFSYPIFRFLFPEFSSLIENKQYQRLEEIRQKFNFYIAVWGVTLVAGSWTLSAFFVSLLFPEGYRESYRYLNILVIGVPFVVYTSFLFSVIKATGHYKQTFLVRVIGFFTFLLSLTILNIVLTHEAIFISYAMLISVLMMFIASFFIERKIFSSYRR